MSFAATESEQICKMITGRRSPCYIPAPQHSHPFNIVVTYPYEKTGINYMEWIMTVQNNHLLILTLKLQVETPPEFKELKQSPRILQKDGKF